MSEGMCIASILVGVIAIGNNCRFSFELTVELIKSINQYDGQS